MPRKLGAIELHSSMHKPVHRNNHILGLMIINTQIDFVQKCSLKTRRQIQHVFDLSRQVRSSAEPATAYDHGSDTLCAIVSGQDLAQRAGVVDWNDFGSWVTDRYGGIARHGLGDEANYAKYHHVLNRAAWSSLTVAERLLSW